MSKTKNDNTIKVGGVEYKINYFDENQREDVMNSILLDQMQSKNGKAFISFTSMRLTIQNGAGLTREQINDLPNEDLILLSNHIMDYNEKKRVKKQSWG